MTWVDRLRRGVEARLGRRVPMSLLEDSVVYSLGPIIGGALAVGLIPVLTRILEPAQYGVADTAIAFSTTVTMLVTLGLDSAAGRYFFDADDEGQVRRILSTGLVALLASCGLAVLALLAAAGPVTRAVLGDIGFREVFLVAVAAVPFQVLESYLKHILRWRRRRIAYVAVYVLTVTLRFGLAVALALWLGAIGMVLGLLAAYAVSTFVGLALSRRSLGLEVDRPLVPRLLRYGAPLLVTGVATPLLFLFDRSLLIRMASLEQAGIYGAAITLTTVYVILSEGYRQAWGPLAFASWNEPGFRRSFARYVSLYWVLGCGLVMALSLLAVPMTRLLLAPAYADASRVIALLALGWMASDLLALFGIGLYHSRRTLPFAAGAALMLGTGLLLDLLLIPRWGILGSAAANTAAKVLAAGLVLALSQRHMSIPYPARRMGLLGGLTLGVVVLAAW